MALVVATVKVGVTVGVFVFSLARHRKGQCEGKDRRDAPCSTASSPRGVLDEDVKEKKNYSGKENVLEEDPLKDHRPPLLAGARPVMGDLSRLETCVNVITCAPYFVLARAVPVCNFWSKLFSFSCTVTGACATLYHLSTGRIRHFFRRLDYVAVASSAVTLTMACSVPRPLFMAGLSMAIAPFQPLLVSGAHVFAMEMSFLKDALGNPKMRERHLAHTSTSLLAFAAFFGDDWFPQMPYLHAGWHVLSAYATSLTFCKLV